MMIDDTTPLAGEVDSQPLTEAQAEGWVPRTCFKHGPPGRAGIELEYLVHSEGPAPARHLDREALRKIFDHLDHTCLVSRFTVEPGGQVELSSRPGDDLTTVIDSLADDLRVVGGVLAVHGARLVGAGIDPLPPPARHLLGPRYSAMEEYFDQWGPAGRAMMRSTASVQVNVEAARTGRASEDARRRWDLLHALGPVLSATFATSGRHDGPRSDWDGYACLRQGVWLSLDQGRCGEPRILPTESLPDAWTRWVLDAPVAMVRRAEGSWKAPTGLTFRQWLRAGRSAVPDAGPPSLDDLQYHMTTLFPPVRARGHLEVRYLDAQPGRWWRVPAAVVLALLEDDEAHDHALAACEPYVGHWRTCAREGLADPGVARSSRRLLNLAADSLQRRGMADLALLTAEYLDRRPTDPSDPVSEEVRPR